ncbi:MAG TPA: hypothetical protein VFT39_11530 [Vicinamibacterales bacterium]|nr:hypothetical protein [Vicinamibacterales bacterium]
MRRVVRLFAAAAIGFALLLPPVVRAQSPAMPAQQPVPGWIFTPSISFGGTWDDNVLLVNPGTNPPSDYGSPITPAGGLTYTGKFTRFSTGYSGSFVRYMTLTELNGLHQTLHATLDRRVNERVTFFGQESFTAAQTTDVLQLAGVPFYRVGSRSNAATGGIQAALTKRTTLRSSYTLRTVDFDKNLFSSTSLQGGHAHDITTTVDYALSRRLAIGGEYEFSRAIVNGETFAGVPGPEDRFNMQTATATAQYQLAAGTSITGGFGVAMLGAGLHHDARTGPEWRAGFSQKTGRGVVAASYMRSYIPSFGFGGTFQNQQWTANIRMPVARRAYVDGGFSWLQNDPLDTSQPSLQTKWLSATAGYYLTRWLSAEGFFGRTQQDSQRVGGQLERNQAGFRVVAIKPVKLR